MAKQNILVGASANDKAGDTLRNAFVKVNANFTELYTLTGGTSTALTELAQDYAAPMFNHASHVNITAVYDDANNKILLTGVASAVWPVTNTAGANGPTRIAIGNSAGDIAQGNATVAVGSYAGNDTQGGAAVAIGTYAGTTTQRNDAIAIGYLTGNDVQGIGAVSIGRQAGQTNQGAYSIAIGKLAGQTNQAANTIILNALNAPLNGVSAQTNSFYVNPIRTDATPGNILFYNTTTKEITYGAAGSVSSLVNGAKTISLASTGILTLPAPLALLTSVSQLATDTAKIYRATNSTDLTAITEAWDNWYVSEWVFRTYVQEDESGRGSNFPWHGMPSWEAYPLIMNWNSQGGPGLPLNAAMAPAAKTAQDNYLTYKQLVSGIDIVNGNKTISFNNTGLLSLPGKLEFKDTANAKIILKTIDPFGYVVEDPTQDKTWTFNANGSLTFPNATTQTTAWTGSVSSLVNGAQTVSLSSSPVSGTTFSSGLTIHRLSGSMANITSDINKVLQIATQTSNGRNEWSFGTDGKLTAPGNLQVDGGKIILNTGGNAYVESVDYGVNSANSAVNIFGGPYQKIKLRAGFGTEAAWTFGTDGTTTFPNNSIKNSLDNSTAITTQRTLTANNSYTNVTDFSTDVDLGGGLGVIAGWYQRNASQIEFALFGPSAFVSYLTGLALGRTVIVTYNTASGTSTLTGTVTQAFTQQGQSDPNNPSWGRVSGRIDATLPVGQLGIVSINFPVYSTSTNDWTFGTNGSFKLPNNSELRPSTAAYDSALASWEYIRSGEITDRITSNLATAEGWPMVNWHPTGLTAQGYIDFLLNAWTVQNILGGTLIVYPAMSNSFYQQMRTILINIRDNYSLTSSGVSISSGYAKSWNFNEDGKLTFPDGTSQTGAGVQSIHGYLTTANAGGYTVTRNGLTVSIVWDNTSGVAGIIKIAFDSNINVTERTVTLRASSQVNSSYIGTNTALTANQAYTIATLTNLGDFSTTHIITGSYNIYRITAVLQQADAPGGNPVAAGYATIEQLR